MCLSCIAAVCESIADSVLSPYWNKRLQAHWAAYYDNFYTDEEIKEIDDAIPDEEYVARLEETMDRIAPLLQAKGFVHVRCGNPSCTTLCCLTRTVKMSEEAEEHEEVEAEEEEKEKNVTDAA
jgi:hypothetical protein